MATPETPKSPTLKRNKNCTPDQEINILLLGQTGVGKTTFINAFTNYLVYDTLEEAMKGEMQVPIPSSFSFTDPETFEQRLITVGNEKNREKVNENGQSGTEQCRSFVFPIGKQRNLRLIDTPGMGDTRGSEQDNKNLFEILTYISHYEHLNGICIFLKPNEERLTISFRLCIKQILHYLNERVNENIIFIFTNARSTFFMPGSSKKLLQVLLNEYRDKNDVEVPFKKDNTFLLDNELFHCLALHKNGIKINSEQLESYKKNWDHAIKEYERLLTYVFGRSRHVVGNELSVNGAEQLIRKLRRPIAEILRLIQQNIQIAGECRQELSKNPRNSSHGFYQNAVQIVPFQPPRLVCGSKKCLQIVNSNNGEKKPFYPICQKVCYLNGVMQEAISDPRMAQCDIFDKQTGESTVTES
jgi:GTPase SAR1 family protein